MSRENVVSDSTFYIAFLKKGEINDPMTLLEFLRRYQFTMGPVVRKEIREKHAELIDRIGVEKLVEIEEEYNYAALLSIIGDRVFKKGEYESMAIAYMKLKEGSLHSLLIDDWKARNWLKNNIPELKNFLKFSLRFIANSCIADRKFTKKEVFRILKRIKSAIENDGRPFNLTEKDLNKVEQLIKEVERVG